MSDNTTTQLDSWLIRIRNGDEAAFGELVVYFARRLESLTSPMLKRFPAVSTKDETGDVNQEALLRLKKALSALATKDDGPAGRKTFHGVDFFRFAALQIRRELFDLAAHYGKRPVHPLPDAELIPSANDMWNPSQMAEWTEFHEEAAKLPDQVREVFDLVYYDGLKQEEAAAMLGVSARTVRSRMLHAKIQLGTIFGGRIPGS